MTVASSSVTTPLVDARQNEQPSHSERRARLIARFDAVSPRFLSLDVFDTLLARPFEKPVDLFVEIHRTLPNGAGVDAKTFARMRREAEAAARKREPSFEVGIDEIATELSRALHGQVDPATLVEREFACESAFIQLDHDVAELVLHAARRGVPYVLVSDMYLRSEQILELLMVAAESAGVELPQPAHVFVSGERRANKVGRMFDVILAELGCAPSDILHIGDHPDADFASPLRRGIHAEHVFRDTPFLCSLLDAESHYHSHGAGDHHYDIGLRTTRLKAVTSAIAAPDTPFDHFQYGAFVLGPLFTLYAEWIVEDCMRHGQHRVFCLMREGHLLKPLIEKAAEAHGAKLEVRNLWASRYAIRAASFHDVTERELRFAFYKRRNQTIDLAARDLGIDVNLVRVLSGIDHGERLNEQELDRLTHAILGSPQLRQQMLETSAENRRRLFDYYSREGVFDDARFTIVDLGWGGTMQRRLSQAFRDLPKPKYIRALYLATHGALFELPRNCTADSFLFHLAQPNDSWLILQRTPEILENACMPRDGSFRGIDESGEPTFFPQVVPPRQLDDIAEIQRGIFRFAELWLPGSKRRREHLTFWDEYVLAARLRSILARSLQAPTAEEVRLFDHWGHDANDGALDHENLIGSPEVRARARSMSYEQIMQLPSLDTFWPAALARLLSKSPAPPNPVVEPVRRGAALIARSTAAITRILQRK